MLVAALVVLTAGCVTTLSPELMVPPQPLIPAAHRSGKTITVAPVTSEGSAKTEVMDSFVIGNEQFQTALVSALGASGIFRSVASAGAGDYELQARIVSQQSQRAGFLTVSSTVVVNYHLREADRDVWYETIISEDTEEGAPFTEGVPGAAKKSLAGAARRNVVEMLQKLAERVQ